MTDREWNEIAPYMDGSRAYYEGLAPDYEGAEYDVCANVYSEQLNDYVAHFEGHTFRNYEMASDFFRNWMPPEDEVQAALMEANRDGIVGHFEVEVAIWDETGNLAEEDDFYNETVGVSE